MKKLIVLLSILLLPFTFMSSSYAKFKVVTTFTVLEDIAKNIAGDKADVKSLTKIGAEIHSYEPSPKDLITIRDANLLISNGLNLERWFNRFTQDAPNIPKVIASSGITPINIESGPYKGTPNPHGWMSITNARIYIKNITDAFVKYDPENAKYYQENSEKYLAKIESLYDKAKKVFDKYQGKNIWLITSEGAFSYLIKDFPIKYDSIWPVNAEDVGTPKQISRIINLVKKYKIPVVFSGSTMDSRPMETVIKATGTHFGGYIYVDTLSEKDGPTPTYYDMLYKTITTISDGFSKYTYGKK